MPLLGDGIGNGIGNRVTPVNVVFVHGLFSSGRTWQPMLDLIEADEPLNSRVRPWTFEYSTPKAQFHPARQIPELGTVADALKTFIDTSFGPDEPVVLVAHSQGGLIVERYLVRLLTVDQGSALRRIQDVVLFATPHSGSEFFLSLRRATTGWRHPQEAELRPFVSSVADTLRTFLGAVVNVRETGPGGHRIRVTVFAGESDKIVPPASALSVFPSSGVLPGDHSSVIRPESANDLRYLALRRILMPVREEMAEPQEPDPSPAVPPSQSRPRSVQPGAGDSAPVRVPPVSSGAQPAHGEILNALLAIQEFRGARTREEIVNFLPPYITTVMPTGSNARLEVLAMIRTCDRFGEPGRMALLATVEVTCPPEDPAVQEAIGVIRKCWDVATAS
jgi:pimeloyl-ACP methyl ester carboxylesterase